MPTRSARTPYLDPGAGGPSRSFLLTHPKAAFNPFDVLFYLIVASKTWTVESLSNDTVLITNLTAFWNSDEFPIIFKKRNTNHYNGLKWHWGCVIAGAGPLHLNVRTCGLATRGSRNTKRRRAQLSLRTHSGTDGKPISTKLKHPISKWQNCVNNSS